MNRRIFYLNITLLFIAVLLAVGTFSPGGLELIQKTLAAVTGITGEGTINYLSRFAGAANPSNQIGDSIIYDSGTNIGIGTTAPGAKLDITGLTWSNSLKVSDRTLANGYLDISSGWDGVIRINSGAAGTININREVGVKRDLNIWYGTAEFVKFDGTNARVGIGTAAPATKLHVNGAMMLTPLASDPTGLVNGMMWMRQ